MRNPVVDQGRPRQPAPAGRAPWAVEVAGVTKTYGGAAALRGVDLQVDWGEHVALFGPNGAGKTTLLRLLALLLRPTSGTLRLGGRTLADAGTGLRRHVGFLGHQAALYADLTVRENLAFYAKLYGLAAPEGRIDYLLERVGLADRRQQPAGALSRGLQQRLGLARALLPDPAVLLLDEPETGLDGPGMDLLGGLLSEGHRTVLLSTHRLEEGQRLGQRALVLVDGRVVRDGPAATLDRATLAAIYAGGRPV